MASTSNCSTIILLFMFSSYFAHPIEAKILGKHEVYVTSDVPPNSGKVTVHCYSKGDNIGTHELYPGQFFSWHFKTTLFASTLFSCHFLWGSKQKSLDVFDGSWDSKAYYHVYSYVINADGVFLSNDPNDRKGSLGLVSLW